MSSPNQTRKFLLDGLELDDFQRDRFTSNLGSAVIRRLDPEEKDNQGAKSVLEITSNNSDNQINLASRIVTCIRLSGEGGIGYNREFIGKDPCSIQEYGLPYRPPKGKEDTYRIESSKLIDIRNRFKTIEDIMTNQENADDSPLRLAFSRFNRSYDDANEGDILIDLMICFEILFMFGESGKADVVARRAKEFLKKETKVNYPELYRDLYDAYKIRNYVVHDGMRYNSVVQSYYSRIAQPWCFLLAIRNYCRLSLGACIQWLTNNKTAKLKDLKDNVIKSL